MSDWVLKANPDYPIADDDLQDNKKMVSVGVCAMAKKVNSRPMQEILERLRNYSTLEILIFSENMVLYEDINNWPIVDCLISFHSKGFPLDKAVRYSELRKPFVLNDLYMQYKIQDRREVYRVLEEQNIDLPRYSVLDRGNWENKPDCEISDLDSTSSTPAVTNLSTISESAVGESPEEKPTITATTSTTAATTTATTTTKSTTMMTTTTGNDERRSKSPTRIPIIVQEQLIEKNTPAAVAYPSSSPSSSPCSSPSTVIKPTTTDTDPVLKPSLVEFEDIVEVNGNVFHKPLVEKPISAEDHNVYIYFPQSAGGGSQRLFRKVGSRSSVYSPVSSVRETGSYIYEEFMATDGTDVKVYTVGPEYAHAEARKSPALDGKVERDKAGKEIRYPVILSAAEKLIARNICLAFKQTVCGFDLLRANGISYVCDVNGFSFVKTSPKYYDDCAMILGDMILREVAPHLHIPYSVINYQIEDVPIVPTTYGTLMELRCVIAIIRHGDRTPKQKMKMEVRHKSFFDLFEKYGGYKNGQIKLKRPQQLQEMLDIARSLLFTMDDKDGNAEIEEKRSKLLQLKAVLEMYGRFSGINRKVQLKYQPNGAPKRSSDDDCDTESEVPDVDIHRDPSLVLILKWGGELTPAGKIQAEKLGQAFRCMYPGGEGDYGQDPGQGLLRLHSTFRHDLKIYASDEGRVQMTAAAFAKGLLALEGELTPIMVQMVKSSNMNGLLDNDHESHKYQKVVKDMIQKMLNKDEVFTEADKKKLAPNGAMSILKAMALIKNPHKVCARIYDIMKLMMDVIRDQRRKCELKKAEYKLYHGESWELMIRRWLKLIKDFKLKGEEYDISKIPDIYDCIKYDIQHNMRAFRFTHADELHVYSKAMADIVIPQEYGITTNEKMAIAQSICAPLMKKILCDLHTNSEEESTRLDGRSYETFMRAYSTGVTTPHRHVKTRLYFTSESHVHSLLTVLRYGGLIAKDDEQWERASEYLKQVTELNYMTQIVIMLYEDPSKDAASEERYHVELHFSPGAYTCGQKTKDPNSLGYRSRIKQKNEEMTKERERTNSLSRNSSQVELDLGLLESMSKIDYKSTEQLEVNGSKIVKDIDKSPKTAPSSPIDITNQVHSYSSLDTLPALKNHSYKKKSEDGEQGKPAPFEDQLPPMKTRQQRNENRSCSLETNLQRKHLDDDSDTGNRNDRRMAFLGLFSQALLGDRKAKICPSTSLPLLNDSRSIEGCDVGSMIPSIRALETLHNELTLKQIENLLIKVTEMQMKSPFSSPGHCNSSSLTKLADVVKNKNDIKQRKESKLIKNVLTKDDIPIEFQRVKSAKNVKSSFGNSTSPANSFESSDPARAIITRISSKDMTKKSESQQQQQPK